MKLTTSPTHLMHPTQPTGSTTPDNEAPFGLQKSLVALEQLQEFHHEHVEILVQLGLQRGHLLLLVVVLLLLFGFVVGRSLLGLRRVAERWGAALRGRESGHHQ